MKQWSHNTVKSVLKEKDGKIDLPADVTVGPPRKTGAFTSQELSAKGMVGIYVTDHGVDKRMLHIV